MSDGSASRQAKLLTETGEGVGNKVVLLEHSKEIYLLSPCEKSRLYGQVGLDVESVSSLMALDEISLSFFVLIMFTLLLPNYFTGELHERLRPLGFASSRLALFLSFLSHSFHPL